MNKTTKKLLEDWKREDKSYTTNQLLNLGISQNEIERLSESGDIFQFRADEWKCL